MARRLAYLKRTIHNVIRVEDYQTYHYHFYVTVQF